MTTYPASNLKSKCVELDPISIKFLESIGIKVSKHEKINRD